LKPTRSATTNWLVAQIEFQKAGELLGRNKFQDAEKSLRTAALELPPPYGEMAKEFAQRAGALPAEKNTTARMESAAQLCAELQSYPAALKLRPSKKRAARDDDESAIPPWYLFESGNIKAAVAEYKRKLKNEYVDLYQDYYKKQIQMMEGRAANLSNVTAGLELVRERYLSGLEEEADFFGALRELNRILPLAKDPNDAILVYQQTIKCLQALNDEAGSKVWEDKLLADFPSQSEAGAEVYYDRSLRAYHERKDYETALKLMRQLCQQWPDSVLWGDAQYSIGLILQDQKKFDEAITEFSIIFPSKVNDRLLAEGSTDDCKNYRFKTALRISECYESKNDLQRALEFAKMANDRYPYYSYCSNCSDQAKLGADRRVAELNEKIKAGQ
jgi:tetratricopeptide (TPR) repeat protein